MQKKPMNPKTSPQLRHLDNQNIYKRILRLKKVPSHHFDFQSIYNQILAPMKPLQPSPIKLFRVLQHFRREVSQTVLTQPSHRVHFIKFTLRCMRKIRNMTMNMTMIMSMMNTMRMIQRDITMR